MKHDLIKYIEERMPTFSKGQKQIARYIVENYDKAAYMTASRLGANVNVSESTVVRFVVELGYEGYPEFQRSLQELIRTRLTSFQRMEVTNNLIGNGDILEKVLLSDAEKIKKTLEQIDRDAFHRAVDALIHAHTIYIIGVRSSATLAGFLNFTLRMMFDNIKFVQTATGSEMFEQLISLGKDDVLLAISFPRYTKRIIHAVEFAHDAGANVISLTDSKFSPIAAGADELLTAQSDMASFVDSLVAPLSILNALVVALSREKQTEVTERLRKLEKIWDDYDVYDKNQ